MSEQRVDLIYQEFLLRQRLGYNPDPAEYIVKFPDVADELQKQFALLHALQDDAGSWLSLGESESTSDRSTSDGSMGRLETQAAEQELHAAISPVLAIPGYQLLRSLGQGSSGSVYEAIQESTGRHVALKVLARGASMSRVRVQRFRLESRIAASLDVDGIVPIYEVGNVGDTYFHSMRLIRGPDLRQTLRILRYEPLDDVDPTHVAMVHDVFGTKPSRHRCLAVARVIADLSRAIERAHGLGVMHRDIKPANILLDQEGRPWLTDFGLAHLDGEATMTGSEEVIGTPVYMSPERFLSKTRFVSPSSDIYALGVTLYELLTLRPPFLPRPIPELIQQIVETEPPGCRSLNEHVSRDLETIVGKAMAKLPADRYVSAGELAADLDRFQKGEPILARRLSWVERTGRRLRKHAALVTGLAALAILAISIYASHLSSLNRRLQASELRAKILQYASEMNLAYQAFKAGQMHEVERTLLRHIPESGQVDYRGPEWHFLEKQSRAPIA